MPELRRTPHGRARDAGVRDERGGAVTIVQRFGGALNMNIHFHVLVMDGVFARDGDAVRFHPTPSLDAAYIDAILATIEACLRPVLARHGADAGDDSAEPLDPGAEQAPVWAGLAAASVQGRVALGARAGARVRRQGQPVAATPPPDLGSYQARHRGFDLHAGVCVPADHGTAWSGSPATRCGRLSRRTASNGPNTARSDLRCVAPGRTGPHICSSTRSNSWNAWPR